MKIAAYVPTRGQVWWETAARCSNLWWEAAELGYELRLEYAQGNTGVVEVRNMIMKDFLAGDADVLLMCDDDVVPGPEVLRLCETAAGEAFDVVGAPCPMVRPGTTVTPNVYLWDAKAQRAHVAIKLCSEELGVAEVDMVGFGCVALSRQVCAKLKHFKPRQEKGRWTMGEDLEFCLRARSQGFGVAVDMSVPCEHMLTLHGNSLAIAYGDLMIKMLGEEEVSGETQ